ncbi:LysR family transcriptional regulator [Pollutimonas bauzanensis]|uniref:LysR family transcriptional regulator n=1 Tax=Pollutimonas bauzanensis TaxID=658167 RepID=UPI00116014D4|nr:LysR family transcriptional regulator [Pollutimonas bauzanensis]
MKRDAKPPARLDITSARMFVAIIEEGSIAKAALRENIVSSAISKRLADLESQFRVPLVQRGRRGVEPTPAGEAFAHHARMVLQAVERLQAEMAQYIDGVLGYVRVRTSSSSLFSGLSLDIESFSRIHDRVRLELEEDDTPMIVRHIVEGRADVGIGPRIFPNEQLQFLPYRRYELAVVVPEGHPFTPRESVPYSEVLEYDQVELTRSSALAQLLEYSAKQAAREKKTRIRVRGFDSVCMMIASGMGIGIVPMFLQDAQIARRRLVFIPLADEWSRLEICIMIRDYALLPASAQAFVDHLRARAMPELAP